VVLPRGWTKEQYNEWKAGNTTGTGAKEYAKAIGQGALEGMKNNLGIKAAGGILMPTPYGRAIGVVGSASYSKAEGPDGGLSPALSTQRGAGAGYSVAVELFPDEPKGDVSHLLQASGGTGLVGGSVEMAFDGWMPVDIDISVGWGIGFEASFTTPPLGE
jgi:hypothetical protein